MNIVIATGGSGGHIIPALKVAKELRRRHCDVRFIGSFNVWKDRIAQEGFAFDELTLRGLNPRRPYEYPWTLFLFIRAVWQSVRLLRKYKIDRIVGFGGYGAFSVVLAAIMTGRLSLIHEQNVFPGNANALLSRYVTKIAVSFPQSLRYFSRGRPIIVTGCPSHVPTEDIDRSKLLAEFCLEEHRKTILVLGGSQGSHRINEIFIEMIASYKKDIFLGNLKVQVIHLCGKADYDWLKSQYVSLGVPFVLFDFVERMDHIYPLADIVISRAGAVALTELIRFRKPAILIPYPLAGGHQKYNAQIFSEAGVGCYVEQKNFSSAWLRTALDQMFMCLPARELWERAFGKILSQDAAYSLADEIMGMKKCG